MTNSLVIALAQINPTVGALDKNVARIAEYYAKAAKLKADLVVFPEMCLIGYPPEDLVLRPGFQIAAKEAVMQLAELTKGKETAMIIGGIAGGGRREGLYNAAFLLEAAEIKETVCKYALPNYGVFDEKRIFTQGPVPRPITYKGIKMGLLICEDMWDPKLAIAHAKQGAQLLIAINASPFEQHKQEMRYKFVQRNVAQTGLPLVYVNQVGGQDELVFEGHSFVMNADEQLAALAPAWKEALTLTQWKKGKEGFSCKAQVEENAVQPLPDNAQTTYEAMVIGLRDYVEKNRFPGVILGLSGGVDSALSAAVAVDAIGAKRVHSVMMPSPFTSQESIRDAEECARLLGIALDNVSISKTFETLSGALEHIFHGKEPGITEENMQSRLRGVILMAMSNASDHMVLTTGNKSEMAVGYATLYGDMCGGFSVLKDVYKTEVYKLCRWRNSHFVAGFLGKEGRVVPEPVITKAPTAELRANQKDTDSLPPYDILDDILFQMIEECKSSAEIIKGGHGEQTVRRVASLVFRAEYKRRQAPPGVKVTGLSFGRDRRYPITNGYGV
jgi:NAD+ synthase